MYLNGTTLTIQQNIRPLDVVGHKVYMVMDEEDDFATAEELTNPYTVTGTFELKPWAGKARAVFVKTVDELGYLSDYVRLVVDLGDVSTQNILFQSSEKDTSWSGEIVGGYTSSGTLFSEENVARYNQDNSVAAYPQDNSFAFYPSGVVSTLTYSWAVNIPSKYKGARILVTPETTSGKMTSLVFRHYYDVARYSQTNTDAAYLQDDSAVFYPQPTVSDWVSMPEEYYTPGSEKIEMKITYAPSEQAQIQDIKTIIDVEDLEDSLQDVAISATGLTRVAIPSSKYHAITSVVFGLQYEEGSSAFVVKYAKGTETLDTDGYVVLGPYVKAFDASGNLTSANCDIRVRGY